MDSNGLYFSLWISISVRQGQKDFFFFAEICEMPQCVFLMKYSLMIIGDWVLVVVITQW